MFEYFNHKRSLFASEHATVSTSHLSYLVINIYRNTVMNTLTDNKEHSDNKYAQNKISQCYLQMQK